MACSKDINSNMIRWFCFDLEGNDWGIKLYDWREGEVLTCLCLHAYIYVCIKHA
jgi:hypothetical protein